MDNNIIDLHLLIPCKYTDLSRFQFPENIDSEERFFIEQLDFCNNTDFSNEYIRSLSRFPVDAKRIGVTEEFPKKVSLPCFGVVSIHEPTKLTVVDIVVQNITSGADIVVNAFRAKRLTIGDSDRLQSLDSWLNERYGLYPVGEHKCIVFSGQQLSDEEKINFLATECMPMGKIIGSDFKTMATNNIAQYDTAEAYVSEVTLLEISKSFKPDSHVRLAEQAIEVFFMKLILLQDAAISNVNLLIEKAIDDETTRIGNTEDELLALVTELSKATKFFDPRNFYYPTVRASSIRIAEKFGLTKQSALMSENKSILEQLIEINSMKLQNKENDIINVILIILAIIQVVPILFSDQRTIIYTGITCVACFLLIIFLRYKLFRRKRRKHRHIDSNT